MFAQNKNTPKSPESKVNPFKRDIFDTRSIDSAWTSIRKRAKIVFGQNKNHL